MVQTFDFGLDYVKIFEDLQALIENLNRTSATTTSNRPPGMDSTVTKICYRLLSYTPDVDCPKPDFRELCRLGTQIYLQTLVYSFPSCRMFCTLLLGKLEIYLDFLASTTGEKELLTKFMLWLIFFGGIITQEELVRSRFVARLSRVIGQLQLYSWNDVKAALIEFFWVETIHAEPCESLWDEVKYSLTQYQRCSLI